MTHNRDMNASSRAQRGRSRHRTHSCTVGTGIPAAQHQSSQLTSPYGLYERYNFGKAFRFIYGGLTLNQAQIILHCHLLPTLNISIMPLYNNASIKLAKSLHLTDKKHLKNAGPIRHCEPPHADVHNNNNNNNNA